MDQVKERRLQDSYKVSIFMSNASSFALLKLPKFGYVKSCCCPKLDKLKAIFRKDTKINIQTTFQNKITKRISDTQLGLGIKTC